MSGRIDPNPMRLNPAGLDNHRICANSFYAAFGSAEERGHEACSAELQLKSSIIHHLAGPSVSDLLTANHLPSLLNMKAFSSWNVRVFVTAAYNNIHVERPGIWTSTSAHEMSSAQLNPSPGPQLIFSNSFCARTLGLRWPRPRTCLR